MCFVPLTVEYRPYIDLALQGLKICLTCLGLNWICFLEHLCCSQWLLLPPFQLQLWGCSLGTVSYSPSDCLTNHRLLCVRGFIKETQVDPNNEKEEAPVSSIVFFLTEKSSASSWLVTAYNTVCIIKTLNVSLYWRNIGSMSITPNKRPAIKKKKKEIIEQL